jgi:hypothetical protein
VDEIVSTAPFAIVPREQGKAVVQSPVLETNDRPKKSTSSTVTPVAASGPLLVTVIVKTTFSPGLAPAPGKSGGVVSDLTIETLEVAVRKSVRALSPRLGGFSVTWEPG